jgi:Ni,Fe-hydrogenase I cytochrome b subunit
VVAGASAVLVGLSLGATQGAGAAIHVLLALLSIVAIAFGLLVSVSFLTTTSSGDREGYLILIGAILTIHGMLGLAWTALAAVRWRSCLSTTRRA